MKSTWALAALAGVVPALAAPKEWSGPGSYGQGPPAYHHHHNDESSSWESSSVSQSTNKPSSGPWSYGKGNTTWAATATGSYTVSSLPQYSTSPVAPMSHKAETTVTLFTTIFKTVCDKTEAVTKSGTVSLSTYQTVSTTSAVLTHYNGASTPAGPVGGSSATAATTPTGGIVTEHTYQYTTCDKETSTGNGWTSTYDITKTLTTVVTATVYPTESYPAGGESEQPTGYESKSTASASTSPLVYGSLTLTYATPSPSSTDSVETAPVYGSSSESSPPKYTSVTAVYPTSYDVDTTVTSWTSKYTTTCPGSSTITQNGTANATTISTYLTTSTVTTVISSTITNTRTHSYPGGYPGPSGYPAPSGSISYNGTVPPTTASSTVKYPSGNSTISAPYGSGTGVGTTSEITSSSTSSACSSKPTNNDFCIPCEGQPKNDPDNFCGYTIDDNYYNVVPKTCRTREYFFEVTNVTVTPDGIPRYGLVVNGQMPGPLIEANWGDDIVVHLTNKLQNNGTSIHFHGIRQNYTNEMDGVPSITQCALAPGESMTYKWKATNYGTSWYHSHFAIQTWEGVFGPMIIHGPHSQQYDIDSGMFTLQDWSHVPVDQMYDASQDVGPAPQNGPRVLDTGLINGKNTWGSGLNATGSRFETTFVPGKTHLLRVVNTAIQSTFKFHLDGHKFTVISADFVPIVPYETDILNINIGQRYNVLVKADQTPGDYWLRSDNQQACTQLTNSRDIKAIVHYAGHSGTPTSIGRNYTDECVDEPYASLVPVVPLNAGAEDDEIHKTVLVGVGPQTPTLFKWTLDGTTFQSQWGDPTLRSINNNGTIPTYSGNLAIELPRLHEWVYMIIESPIPLPHPIHLHGHDFMVLAQGTGAYSSAVPLNTINPPRRDVAMMPWAPPGPQGAPTGGYLVVAFETDNPGAWLMHCHIGWHVSMGFALQIIENLEGIKSTVTDSCQIDDTCITWNKYATANGIVTNDSGV